MFLQLCKIWVLHSIIFPLSCLIGLSAVHLLYDPCGLTTGTADPKQRHLSQFMRPNEASFICCLTHHFWDDSSSGTTYLKTKTLSRGKMAYNHWMDSATALSSWTEPWMSCHAPWDPKFLLAEHVCFNRSLWQCRQWACTAVLCTKCLSPNNSIAFTSQNHTYIKRKSIFIFK